MEKNKISIIIYWLCITGFLAGFMAMNIFCDWFFSVGSLAGRIKISITSGIFIIAYIISVPFIISKIYKCIKGDYESE